MSFRFFSTAAVALLLLAAAAARAEEPSPTAPPPSQAKQASPAGDQAVPPLSGATLDDLDTYLLRDASGKLVPVVGMKFEDFKKLLDLKLKLAPPAPPSYSVDVLSLRGTAAGELAIFDVQVTLRTREPGWIRIPLRMNRGVLRDPPKYQGGGEQFFTCEPDGEGYICWLKGGEAKPHLLTFSVSARIIESGSDRRITLTLPRATESTLHLEVPLAKLAATLGIGSEGIVSTATIGSNKSEVQVLGAGGELQLAWQEVRELPMPGPALLESSGEITVKVESKNRISSDARLRVRSLGGSVSAFRVRLPPGMELIPNSPNGYTVTPLDSTGPGLGEAASAIGPLVEVKLDRPASGVVEVRLLAALATEERAAGKSNEPAKFQVEGAVRQRGTIDFSVDGDWTLHWTEDASVRRIDLPSDATAAAKTVARFEYFRQPCELKLQVAARPTRISVEPSYVVDVDARQVRLEATLKYRLRGARIAAVTIAAGDWKFDRALPDGIVDLDAVTPLEGKPLVLPLRAGAEQLSEWELKLEAHREIPEGSNSLVFSLPRPVADVVTPATIVVLAADNVEITPHNSELRGLTADSAAAALRLPTRQQQPLVYRDLGAGEPAVFASGFQIRAGRSSVQAEAKIALDEQRITVEQRLLYRISFEARRAFEILVPGELPRSADLRVFLGTQSLPLAPVATEAGTFNAEGRRLRFESPGDQIGPCEFVVKYSLPMPRLNRSTPAAVVIPLVLPAESANQELGGQTIVTTYADDLRVESGADLFEPVASRAEAASGAAQPGLQQLRASLTTMTTKTEWKITSVEPGDSGATNVLKAWVQSWLAPRMRQDRAVWRLTTNQESLRIRLPRGAQLAEAQVALDGQPYDRVTREGADLRLTLPRRPAREELVLEVWYGVEAEQPTWGWLANDLEPPVIVGAGPPRRTYWQVCLPESEHLLGEPGDFAAELTWHWQNFFWARRSLLDQAQLESWIGGSRQEPFPAATNQYLFSSVGRAAPLHFTTCGRRFLMLLASCSALGLGLLLLHVRQARQPGWLLAGAIVLAAGVLIAPETALFLSEAAALGLALVVLAAIWMWIVGGRTAWQPVTKSYTLPVDFDQHSTEAAAPRVERAVTSTTATAPFGIAASEQRL